MTSIPHHHLFILLSKVSRQADFVGDLIPSFENVITMKLVVSIENVRHHWIRLSSSWNSPRPRSPTRSASL